MKSCSNYRVTTSSRNSSGSSVSNHVDQQSKVAFDIYPSHTNIDVIDLQAVEARVKNDTTTRKTYY